MKTPTCKVCASTVNGAGFCADETCVHNDWPQSVDREMLTTMTQQEAENHFGVKKRRPVNDSFVFQNVEGELGVLWNNLCVAENALAEKLKPLPLGTAVVLGLDAWLLRDDGDKLVLVHGNYIDGKLGEEQSRFDADLSWVDISEASLQYLVAQIGEATDKMDTVFLGVPEVVLVKERRYETDVRTDGDYSEIPTKARFVIAEKDAREIIRLSALVAENHLHKVEKFDSRASWLKGDPDNFEEERTELDSMLVSAAEFWFSAYLKHTTVKVFSDRLAVSKLVEWLATAPEWQAEVEKDKLRMATAVRTSDGYTFTRQSDGSWSDGDMSFANFEEMYVACDGDGAEFAMHVVIP